MGPIVRPMVGYSAPTDSSCVNVHEHDHAMKVDQKICRRRALRRAEELTVNRQSVSAVAFLTSGPIRSIMIHSDLHGWVRCALCHSKGWTAQA